MSAVAELLEYLTPDERAELDALLTVPGPASLKAFTAQVNPRYQWYRHCDVLATSLERVASGELRRLMVFMPPRHGKSELVSRIFPAYYLLKHPEQWVGLASYAAQLAQTFSRVARDHYQRGGGTIRDDSAAVSLWQTVEGGGFWAAGVGGPLTGMGCHLGIIDDPLKNDEEAASETIRAKQKDWYAATFASRLEPNGAVVVVQTRWHQDDLSGWLLEQEALEAEGWHIVNLDAVHEPLNRTAFPPTCTVEPDWRAQGEALCPERYDDEALRKIKARSGAYFWSALYQQRPTPVEGGLFKRSWWQRYDTPPESFDMVVQSWDMAFKDDERSDYVVGQVWGLSGPRYYLLDQIRGRMDFPATVQAVRGLTAKWPQTRGVLIEEAANGAAVIQTLRREIAGIIAVRPQGGKASRAAGVSPLVESGSVWIPEATAWVSDFVEECAAFPTGTHDDQVDAMSQALTRLGGLARAKLERYAFTHDENRSPGWDYGQMAKRKVPHAADEMDHQRAPLTSGFRLPRGG